MGRRATQKPPPPPEDSGVPPILSQESEMVPVEHLVPHPDNPNHGDLRAVMDSIRAFGFWGTITVNRRTRHICAGNHRYEAAKQLGMTHVPVSWVSVSDDREKVILAADNRIAELAKRDDEKLAAILADIQATETGLEGTGYDDDDLDKLIGKLSGVSSRPSTSPPPSDSESRVQGREIHLAFKGDDYTRAVEYFEILMVRMGCETYSEVCMQLLEDAAP